eukprot:CAMPEP_0175047536 /NCGR_PEP_ID=MMETSP0052_2-20121109/5656_1 /TAXON_ID=51329 ORGANISM="Polytomella parva, Strain SAG 63-3" /NCGR_SAMPLE_ID=MMETSP0052_2 /ASSEMBLY_ACC=CAM_ASM_000194 /LENGTH=311 /DNA_ID=CAMNT_0016311435 /DNA_START=211 /DNA_END=1146 /DNA_ORIENTATION=+
MGDKPLRFSGSSANELRDWLIAHRVSTEDYGKNYAKSVEDLFQEIQDNECCLISGASSTPLSFSSSHMSSLSPPSTSASLSLESPSPLQAVPLPTLRLVNVLSLLVVDQKGNVLIEQEQILPDGRRRRRHIPLSEKMIGDETWQEAARRAVREELGSVLPEEGQYEIRLFPETYNVRTERSASKSYPGLVSEYRIHQVVITIPGIENANVKRNDGDSDDEGRDNRNKENNRKNNHCKLYESESKFDFSTVEPRPNGTRLVTFWAWEKGVLPVFQPKNEVIESIADCNLNVREKRKDEGARKEYVREERGTL